MLSSCNVILAYDVGQETMTMYTLDHHYSRIPRATVCRIADRFYTPTAASTLRLLRLVVGSYHNQFYIVVH